MKEKWQEIYTEEQLNRIQKLEIQSLKDFINVCEKLKIEYIVYGGTLLGSIKYKNIIPWDDDVDVALPRDDYNKFIKYAGELLGDKYVIQSPYNESKSPWCYTKMRIKGTKMIEKFHNRLDIEKGVYIDIYAIDNIPDNEILRRKQYKKVKFLITLYYLRQCRHVDFSLNKIAKYVIHSMAYFILRFLPQSFYLNKIDKEMTRYNSISTRRKGCLYSPNYDNIYTKFYPLERKKFGDLEVNVPNCYDDHLTKRYGNYMVDLPKEKIGHEPFEIEV